MFCHKLAGFDGLGFRGLGFRVWFLVALRRPRTPTLWREIARGSQALNHNPKKPKISEASSLPTSRPQKPEVGLLIVAQGLVKMGCRIEDWFQVSLPDSTVKLTEAHEIQPFLGQWLGKCILWRCVCKSQCSRRTLLFLHIL